MKEKERILSARGIEKIFYQRDFWGRKKIATHAVQEVDLDLYKGECYGLVGESGCGKSTLGRCLLGLLKRTEGEVYFHGKEVRKDDQRAIRKMQDKMQIIFQDPYSSLNPHWTVEEILKEPLRRLRLSRTEEETKINDILKLEILELDLGYGLLKLADVDLIERIRAMRRNIASSLGFLMPKIRIRDNLQLPPNEYRFKLKGNIIGQGEIYADKFLAMDSGLVSEDIEGIPTKEPAFGLDALWIDASVKEDAILSGYTIVDPASVISTHMSELIKQNAAELLTRQETQNLLDKLKIDYPVVVEDTLRIAPINLIQKVLKTLLKDNIPIKDLLSILEAISDIAEVSKNLDMIIEHVRAALSRVITSLYVDEKGQLNFYILDTAAQQKLMDAVQYKDGAYHLMINVAQTSSIVQALRREKEKRPMSQHGEMVLCVEPSLRKFIANICANFSIDIVVLSFAEISANTPFETVGVIEIENL